MCLKYRKYLAIRLLFLNIISLVFLEKNVQTKSLKFRIKSMKSLNLIKKTFKLMVSRKGKNKNKINEITNKSNEVLYVRKIG